AGGVGAGPLLLLADHAAHRVRNLLLDAFLDIADAVDGLLLHFRDPNLLAALPRRALHAHRVALTRAPDATAAARIPRPAAGLADALLHDRAGDAFFVGFPVTAANVDGLGVVHRLADRLRAGAVAGFIHWLANVHAVRLGVRLVNGLADRVANVL